MRGLTVLLALVALAPGAAAQDAGYRVSPVIVHIPAERGIGSFVVYNGQSRDVAFDVQAFAWSQTSGADDLTPTREIVVAPSVFMIAAGAEQIVRVGSVDRTAHPQERAYRLIVRELPQPDEPRGQFRMRVEMSLPVFVRARGQHSDFSLTREQGVGGAEAIFANAGAAHVALSLPPRTREAIDTPPRYVLAGARIARPLNADVGALELVAADPSDPAPRAQTYVLDHAPGLAAALP